MIRRRKKIDGGEARRTTHFGGNTIWEEEHTQNDETYLRGGEHIQKEGNIVGEDKNTAVEGQIFGRRRNTWQENIWEEDHIFRTRIKYLGGGKSSQTEGEILGRKDCLTGVDKQLGERCSFTRRKRSRRGKIFGRRTYLEGGYKIWEEESTKFGRKK